MTPSNNIHAHHERARGCHCPEPVGDPREGTCLLCGHQAPGYDIPTRITSTINTGADRSIYAKPNRKYRPAL